VRPVPIAPPAARPAPLWSASSLREAFLIASSTDATKDEAIRSSSVRRVPMRAAYRTPQPFCKGIIARAFEFSLRLSSRHLVTKVFDLVEFVQRLVTDVYAYPLENCWNQETEKARFRWRDLTHLRNELLLTALPHQAQMKE